MFMVDKGGVYWLCSDVGGGCEVQDVGPFAELETIMLWDKCV